MKKHFSKISLTLLICIHLMIVLVNPARAQVPTATPTNLPASTISPTSTLSPTLISPSDTIQLANTDVVSFSQFGWSEIQLNGPYDATTFYFTLPADWALKDGIQLDLLVGVSFNAGLQDQGNVSVVGGGTLTVLLNNNVVLVTPLNDVGETEIKIDIPVSTTLSEGAKSLRFVLDSGASCRVIGLQTTVYIHPTSYFYFPHDFVKPSTSLLNFPQPIFQNSFFPDAALLVIPDQPTAAELQAALTVAAGLGKLSFNQLILNMIPLSNLRDDLTKTHLIFIGKASSLPLLDGLNLPLPPSNGQFESSEGELDDGLIEMINSPWSSSHVALIVSANTDIGVVKAAQALSSGVIRPNRFDNLAVIDQINNLSISRPQAVDQTLSDLGYDFRSFKSKGEFGQEYLFNIPAGMTIGTEAYFDLVYGHSALIDYTASQIVILLNDQPIGSIRMNDTTAVVPTNHAKIMLPPSAVLPGENRLSVRVTIESVDDCASPNSRGLWINVWPQSLIHLPLIATSFDPLISQDLATYPAPFVYDSTLGNTAFVLEHNPESWQNAMQIAFFLGNQVNGPLIKFSAFYGDAIPETERSKYNLLVIGRPSQMPIVAEINNALPAPFLSNSDIASENSNFQVSYRIPPDSPMGYVETIPSPWNSENVVLAILGNTIQGVNWATTALVDSTLRWQLGGSFAVVNDKQIISSSSTRYVETGSAAIPATEMPNIFAPPLSETATNLPNTRPGWIFPVLTVSICLIVLITATVLIRDRLRISNRKQGAEARGKDNTETINKK